MLKKIFRSVGLVGGLILLVSLAVPTQGQTAATFFITALETQRFPEVRVDFRVVDGNHEIVNNLKAPDVALWENSQTLPNFDLQSRTDGPVHIVFVIDQGRYSTGHYNSFQLPQVREAITILVSEGYFVDGRDTVEVLSTINRTTPKIETLLPSTSTGVDLTRWVGTYGFNEGQNSTNGLAGVEEAIKKLSEQVEPGQGTTAIIFITNRLDEPPARTQNESAQAEGEKAWNNYVPVYVFHVWSTDSATALNTLADESGGKYVALVKNQVGAGVRDIYRMIDARRTLYTAIYRSTNGNSGVHPVQIGLAGSALGDPGNDETTYEVALQSPVITITAPTAGQVITYNMNITVTPNIPVTAVLGDWPDGYPRRLAAAELRLGGNKIGALQELSSTQSLEFNWDLSVISATGVNTLTLEVAVTDELGLSAAAQQTVYVNVIKAEPPNLCRTNPSACWTKILLTVTPLGCGCLGVMAMAVAGVLFFMRRRPVAVETPQVKEMAGAETIIVSRSAASSQLAKLEILHGPPGIAGQSLAVLKPTTVIGRDASVADIVFYENEVQSLISRRHCTLALEGSTFHLTDHSANGVMINNQTVPRGAPMPLQDGDEVLLGSAEAMGVRFRFHNLVGATQVWSRDMLQAAQAAAHSGVAKPAPPAPKSKLQTNLANLAQQKPLLIALAIVAGVGGLGFVCIVAGVVMWVLNMPA